MHVAVLALGLKMKLDMNRRDLFRCVALAVTVFSGEGCSHKTEKSAAVADGDIELLTRELTGVALKPGQAASIRKMLATMRFHGHVDPSVQPSLVFDPEVDIE
jgi:hypothetical protein